jgi:hypothetical protein
VIIPDSQIGQLTVRHDPEGGDLLGEVTVVKKVDVNYSDIIILVHGYNVDLEGARIVYGQFLDKFGAFFPSGCPYNIYHFYWPGDVKNKLLSALSYPWEIPVARDAAALLCSYLQALPKIGNSPLRFYFVAHSLGNRLVLEEINDQFDVDFPHGIMVYAGMASAVPVYMVEDSRLLNAAAMLPAKTLMLYSTSDPILHWAFPAGQTVAGEGFFPEAIGRNGNPSKYMWSARQEMYGYGHGSYWDGPESTSAVGSALGIPVPNMLPQAVVASRPLNVNDVAEANSIPSRELLSRSLIGA